MWELADKKVERSRLCSWSLRPRNSGLVPVPSEPWRPNLDSKFKVPQKVKDSELSFPLPGLRRERPTPTRVKTPRESSLLPPPLLPPLSHLGGLP